MSSNESLVAAVGALAATGALAVCTWEAGADPRLLAATDAFARLLGLEPRELQRRIAAGDLRWRDVAADGSARPGEADAGAPGPDAHALREQHLRTHDGWEVATMMATAADAESRVVTLFVDVGEQVRAREGAERASAAKSRFLGVVTHELRTPLNVIGGQVDLLVEGVCGALADPQMKALQRVQRAQRQLVGLVDEVLTFSRLEGGGIDFSMAAVPLVPLLQDVLAAVRSRAEAKGQSLVLEEPGGEVTLWADAAKLRDALQAIVVNAIKFTPPEGRVVVDTATRAELPAFFFVRVTDTGAGVPRDHFERIFEPFTQADERRARKAEGLGLGLAIARDLLRGMGGDVRVRSPAGQGATFTLAVRRFLPES